MRSKPDIRREMRRRRRRLPPHGRQRAAERLAEVLRHHPAYRASHRIACYLPADGEMDLRPLIRIACDGGKLIYLPVLVPTHRRRLRFRRYHPGAPLSPNRFGIPEPVGARARHISPQRLDLVLAPLVAFDTRGNRLGMGGGFYDDTFSFVHGHRPWRRPLLIGVAYAFQETESLPVEPWDIPLWGVATERSVRRFA